GVGSECAPPRVPGPRCHSMMSTTPETEVTRQPFAHLPMYGWMTSPFGPYVRRNLLPARALSEYADHDGQGMVCEYQLPGQLAKSQRHSVGVDWMTLAGGGGGFGT